MHQHDIKKVLGQTEVITLSLGAIIGWGWIVLSGGIVLDAGSAGAVLAFVLSALVFTAIGLTYAELAAAMPHLGGEHVYSMRAFGTNVSFICTCGFLLSPHEALGSRTGSLAPTPAAIAPAEVPTDPDQREEAASIGAASPTMPKNLRAPPTRVRAWARSAPVRRDALHPPSTQPHDTYPTWAVRALQP